LGNKDGKLINGSILIIAKIIKNVVSSASEAEIAALFINARAALPLWVALEEMGHKQPATKLITDNSTADGILNGNIKQNRSKGIDMRYYWLRDRVQQGQFSVQWEPGKFNLADYFTKHHPPTHHKALRPVYLFDPNCTPDLQGCIKILGSRAMGKPAPPRDYPRIKSGPNSSPKLGPVSSHKSLTVGTNTNGQLKCKIYNRPLYMPSHQISNGNIKSNGQILAQLLREIKHLY
jgi:hypothetical protein